MLGAFAPRSSYNLGDLMPLPAGLRLGAYEIQALLGAGGMGEVYRARDLKLKRDVALKVLPAAFTADAERLARFQREAELLAALNHPSIAQIHGTEEADGLHALVLEFVDGQTLDERLMNDGPRSPRVGLDVSEVIAIARQIADGLDAAHQQGIIHRDLKPANIKLRHDGVVKVLDFGLAKLTAAGDATGAARAGPLITQSPTITTPAMTQMGMILGTAAYMSPEQARGRAADKRSDVWAFGCVMYEMLTGARVFEGSDVTDTIAAVVRADPDWTKLPSDTPAAIRRLLRRCLQKDRAQRLADMADARLELDEAMMEPQPPSVAVPTSRRGRTLVPWIVAALAVVTAIGVAVATNRRAAVPAPLARLSVALPPELVISPSSRLAVSPDGSTLVFAATRGMTTQLYERRLHDFEVRPIAGTVDAVQPSFSVTGEWLAFIQRDRLMKMPAGGGAATAVADGMSSGTCWGPDGQIYFSIGPGQGLRRVSETGGPPSQVTTLDADAGEASHSSPFVLPGGRALLFAAEIHGKSMSGARIALQPLDRSSHRVLIEDGTGPRYVPSGHVLYLAQGGALMAVGFDLERLEITGAPFAVESGVLLDLESGASSFGVTPTGTLAYLAGPERAAERLLTWVDRRGAEQAVAIPVGPYMHPRLSPNERQIVLETREADDHLWTLDVARTTLTPIAISGENLAPTWSPDGARIAFGHHTTGSPNIYQIPADGSAGQERLTTADPAQFPGSWSPDGQLLAFSQQTGTSGATAQNQDIWILPFDGDRKPRPFLNTPAQENSPTFSPNGRWLAYVSDESGQRDVSIRPFPGPGARVQVSSGGGFEPVWARNGRELFYRSGDRMMVVSVRTEPVFAIGSPQALFVGRYLFGDFGPAYDVSADGQRFLMVKPVPPKVPTQLHVAFNWLDDLVSRAANR
jgi:serine/threonine protein kinase/Tol biopolymer transport system component